MLSEPFLLAYLLDERELAPGLSFDLKTLSMVCLLGRLRMITELLSMG